MVADESGFIRTVKEMAQFLTKYSPREINGENLGDWRAIKNRLKNGDLQAVIYRKASEISIIYNTAGDETIEMTTKIKQQFDPLFIKAINAYLKDKNYDKEIYKATNSLKFNGVSEFFVFVDYYLWTFTERKENIYE